MSQMKYNSKREMYILWLIPSDQQTQSYLTEKEAKDQRGKHSPFYESLGHWSCARHLIGVGDVKLGMLLVLKKFIVKIVNGRVWEAGNHHKM